MITVLFGRGADGGGVGATAGLGDGHGGPLALEAFQLFVVGHGGNGGVAQALAGHGQQEAGIAIAHFHGTQADAHIGTVLDAAVVLDLAATGGGGAGGVGRVPFVEAIQYRRQHVQLFRVLVLATVILA